MECLKCGTCCTAPDISSLAKPLGERCRHLGEDMLCRIYQERPDVCKGYRSDRICRHIAAGTLEERVGNYLELFGLTGADTAP